MRIDGLARQPCAQLSCFTRSSKSRTRASATIRVAPTSSARSSGWLSTGSRQGLRPLGDITTSERPQRSLHVAAAGPSEVYVFGFEGVICEPESNEVYGNAQQQLLRFEAPFYITSSLPAAQVADRLSSAGAPIAAESPQLFAGLNPTQTAEVLKQISQRPVVKDTGARLNFVSSSVDAIGAARSMTELQRLRLYYAGWSQEGTAGRDSFAGDREVIVLEEKQFSELLSWGLLMGVDDGCGDDN